MMKAILRRSNQAIDSLDAFLGISYQEPQAFEKVRRQIEQRNYSREALHAILSNYNKKIGNDQTALNRLAEIKNETTHCIVTGQQLGLLGGPAYTILKGISCLLLAKTFNAIPLFWLATDDHDIAEIDHTVILDEIGNLEHLHLSFPKQGQSVEDLILAPKNRELLSHYFERLGLAEAIPEISASYAETMARVMVKLFTGTGMVFLEPKLLRPLARSFFRFEIEENKAIQATLKATKEKLEIAGGHAPLPVGKGSNLFLKSSDGQRQKLHADEGVYTAGQKRFSKKEILSLIEQEPERFSTNAAARPLLQNSLLPTLAYVGGPAELEYHRQLGDYHQLHGISMPCIVPRISATMIPPLAAELLEKCGLQPWDDIPKRWIRLMPDLEEGKEALEKEWQSAAERHFGKTLSNEALQRYVHWGSSKLLKKICKTRLHERHLPGYALHLLRNLIYPHNKPQDRVLNWLGFQNQSNDNLIEESIKQLAWKPEGHYYIYLIN